MAGFVKDNDTVLLMKFDNYSNPWYDECGHSWSIYKGTPKLDSSKKKFGNYSVYFNNTELNWLQMSSTTTISELNGHEPWTIEAFVYIIQNEYSKTGSDGNPMWSFFDSRTSGVGEGNRTQFSVTAPYGYPRFYSQKGSGKTIGSKVNTINRWVHHAIVWNPSATTSSNTKGTILSFVDGVYESSNTTFTIVNSVRKIARIGMHLYSTPSSLSDSGQFSGWIDNLRISKIARYAPKNFDIGEYVQEDVDIGDPMTCFLQFDDINNKWYDSYENTTWTPYNNPTIEQDDTGGYVFSSAGKQYIYTKNFVLGGQDFTIDGWAYVSSGSANYSRVFEIFYDYQSKIALYKSGSNIYFEPGNGFTSINVSNILDTFFHFAMVYKHDEKKIYHYVNGSLVGTSTGGNILKKKYIYMALGYPLYDNNGNIGGSTYTNFIGKIDDFRISNYALWEDEFSISRDIDVNSNSDLERWVYNNQYLQDKMRRVYEYR